LTVPANGGDPKSSLVLPEGHQYWSCSPLFSDSEVSWVCVEQQMQGDIWLIENFDPDVK
jgi:hypothetical protein